jgi:hypothetical protein
MSKRQMHYNWDGFKTWCGRSIQPPLKITGFSAYVTCRSCLRDMRFAAGKPVATPSAEPRMHVEAKTP